MPSLEALFTKKKPPLIGIDISSSAVKVLELSKSGESFRVERYAVEPLPQNAVVEHKIAEVEAVSEAIERVIKRSGTRHKHVAVAVPAASVITKTIKMAAAMADNDRQAQIEMEADHYIPYPLDEVNLDFCVLGASESNPEEVDVLMAACRKEVVDDYLAVVQTSGLVPSVVDIETYAMENAYGLLAAHMPGGGMEKTIAMVDVGAASSNINVVHNNRSVYTRDHVFGGRQLTEEIQRRYGLSYEEAGLAKKQGGLPDNYQTDVLRPFMEAMCQEIMRALQFFYSASPFNSVDQIVLAGGCAQITGIDELVAARIGVPAIVANPFASMSLNSRIKPQLLSNDAPSLMICTGLALRSFDE
ncbi:MAG: pilus assembly protein PilM [Candidatus Muproteobacteria bacterium RBG_16_62_13]|uniref:Pilus assembly protein PilM n=1 Tax=Candidatus Muproteobacteria bacterium RBG_16_62_13 TaxID=1817756 RepID=A0A1F6SZT2_9PROT|nr:MAG: pilus assembly protein PilM [Candidatus Muproteobacteria bacterium RBG_16_62_13]